jgi:hypothetical protein
VTVIGETEVSAAVRDQAELTHRIGERRESIVGTLEEYAGNMGVDFAGVARAIWSYLRDDASLQYTGQAHDDEALALLTGVGAQFFLMGVLLGRDHRP